MNTWAEQGYTTLIYSSLSRGKDAPPMCKFTPHSHCNPSVFDMQFGKANLPHLTTLLQYNRCSYNTNHNEGICDFQSSYFVFCIHLFGLKIFVSVTISLPQHILFMLLFFLKFWGKSSMVRHIWVSSFYPSSFISASFIYTVNSLVLHLLLLNDIQSFPHQLWLLIPKMATKWLGPKKRNT